MWQETFAQACAQTQAHLAELETERRVLDRDLGLWHAEVRTVAVEVSQSNGGSFLAKLCDLQERIRTAEERARAIDEEVQTLGRGQIHEDEVGKALANFDQVWDALAPREQARIVQLLVERVDYDGAAQTVSITFHPAGIQALADEIAGRQKETRA